MSKRNFFTYSRAKVKENGNIRQRKEEKREINMWKTGFRNKRGCKKARRG